MERINQTEQIELPAHYVEAITTLAFVLPNQRSSFKLTTTSQYKSELLESSPFIFSVGPSETEKIADINDNEIQPFEIAEDIMSGELRLVINLANPLDSNIYLYDLHDECTSEVVHPVFTSYPDLLSHIMMIRAAGTNIEFGDD